MTLTNRTYKVLLLTGGAFRGALQVHPILTLTAKNEYDLIAGTSVGSINGAMASMGMQTTLLSIWEHLDGIGDFLKLRFFYLLAWLLGIIWLLGKLGILTIGGVYSMKPLRQMAEYYIELKRLRIPFMAGVVSGTSGRLHNLYSDEMKTNQQLWEAIEASSCMAGIMQPPLIVLDHKKELGYDGGFRHIIPIPREAFKKAQELGKTIHCDLVCCTPLDRIARVGPRDMNNTLEIAERGISIMEAEVFDTDILQLCEAVGGGGTVVCYSPSFDTGPSFAADKETIQRRLKEGREMLLHPAYLKRDGKPL